ncbi:MAG TPA: cytochrome c oxidase subunit II [Roseiflexaceae bacterium]|nr:cytochrome c oxidase subunit II [Roseiflexaceae bacterium]
MRTRHRPLGRQLRIALITIAALVLAGCSTLPATTLDTYGDQARRIYDLLIPIAWMALAVFIVVEGILLYTVIRYRRRPDSGIPAQVHGNTRVEIMWTIAPALIVLVIAVLTFRTQAENAVMPADALKVTAVGHQWWFEFKYPGEAADGGDLITASDMYIPVGRSVTVQLEAKDVMHNFWVPKLAGKTYMIPGKTNYITFMAEQPGIYRAVCAEFCGEAHALMRFRVIALDPAEYEGWLEQRRAPPAAATGDPARGEAIFLDARKQCISCHAVDGTAARGNIGPNLSYYGSRLTIGAGILPYSTENLDLWLREAYHLKPGNLMSRVISQQWIAANLTDQEIADLVAYLDSMKMSVALPPAR